MHLEIYCVRILKRHLPWRVGGKEAGTSLEVRAAFGIQCQEVLCQRWI